jgi:acyl-CoA synthetase (AMP-forming)/AMP-acid ligase II
MHYDFGFDKTPANYVPLTPLSFLKRSAAIYPHHVSAVYEDRSFTWAQSYERCRRFASYLASKGVVSGDTVAAMLPNVPAMNEAHFAVPMAGAVLNALNIRLDAPSIAFQLDHGGAKVILVDPEFSDVIAEALAQMKGPKPFVIDVDDTSFKDGRRIGQIEYEDAVIQGDPSFTEVRPEDEWNAIALSYTSGTTGNPKDVVTHHRGAYLNALSNILVGKLGQHPVYLWTLPMFHCNGWCFPWAVAALAGVNVCLRKVEPAKVGDLGVLDEHGYVIVKDRSKDVIISGGENVSSLEIEDVLYKHPAVMCAAVVAKPDPKWGEVPCAFVELKDGAQTSETEIVAFCRSRMPGFKTPKAVVFGVIPKTATGKIQKFLLRSQVGSAQAIYTD